MLNYLINLLRDEHINYFNETKEEKWKIRNTYIYLYIVFLFWCEHGPNG